MSLYKELNVDADFARAQNTIGNKFTQLENEIKPVLVEEIVNGLLKQYSLGTHEIPHSLGKQITRCSLAYADNLCTVYTDNQQTNPLGLDRTKFVRIVIVPLKINGVALETDSTARRLSFWMA